MSATNPEQICHLFQRYMAEGDIEALLNIYDPEAVFLDRSGKVKKGREGLREELAPLAVAKTVFDSASNRSSSLGISR
jgi:ketosteroid isomerase-like protein